jgi:NAD(P)-dependent dehydrogenase (short-subunit alcohol dehydrogenase family)
MIYPFLKFDLDNPVYSQRKFSVQKAYYQSKLSQVMYTYWLAEKLRDTTLTVNSILVTNGKIDVDSRYPELPKLARKMYSLKSKFSISPEKMAETYTFLALSPEVREIIGSYFDDPQHIVHSTLYSRE